MNGAQVVEFMDVIFGAIWDCIIPFIIANLVEKEDIYFVTDLFKSEVDDRRKEMKWLEWIRPDVYAAM